MRRISYKWKIAFVIPDCLVMQEAKKCWKQITNRMMRCFCHHLQSGCWECLKCKAVLLSCWITAVPLCWLWQVMETFPIVSPWPSNCAPHWAMPHHTPPTTTIHTELEQFILIWKAVILQQEIRGVLGSVSQLWWRSYAQMAKNLK